MSMSASAAVNEGVIWSVSINERETEVKKAGATSADTQRCESALGREMDDAELGWAREDAFVSVGLGFVLAEGVVCCAGRNERMLPVLLGAALPLLRIIEPIGLMGDP